MTSAEPPTKLAKILTNAEERMDKLINEMKMSTGNLTPVVSEDLYREIPLVEIYVATIRSPKDISKAILVLNQKLPLNTLQHLKRVTKKEIILCPVENLNGESIEEFFAEICSDLEGSFDEFKEVEVPAFPPKVKKQFEICNKIWPCNFHPNKYNENLVSGNFFSELELKIHRQFMEVVCLTIRYYSRKSSIENDDIFYNATVIVDPTIQSIVAISFENKKEHPVQHAAMLAIDNVAKTQNGGAWVASREKLETIDTTMRGIDEDLVEYLKEAVPQVKFGAKKFKSKKDVNDKNDEIGPYLCTNYFVYMLKEPCVMCSMALVHARAKRVFFCMENRDFGALKSKSKLQTIASLNHHFEVFTGFL